MTPRGNLRLLVSGRSPAWIPFTLDIGGSDGLTAAIRCGFEAETGSADPAEHFDYDFRIASVERRFGGADPRRWHPDAHSYGALQVVFDDGSVGWYEVGWGPLMSKVAFFVKDVIGPKGCVSIDKDTSGVDPSDVSRHTTVDSIIVHSSATDAKGGQAKKDEVVRITDEPDHNELCRREQEYLLRAIRDDIDLSDHVQDTVNSLKICFAAVDSYRTGRAIRLAWPWKARASEAANAARSSRECRQQRPRMPPGAAANAASEPRNHVTHRERFFSVISGTRADRVPFFPDISTWYVLTRIPLGDEQPFSPGQYIPDDSPFHRLPSRLQGELGSLSFIDWYRRNDWGLPCHAYDWYDESFTGPVEKVTATEGRRRTVSFHTPRGSLSRAYLLDAEGTWCETGHMAMSPVDLGIIASMVEATRFQPRHERVLKFLRETEGFGVCDLVIMRSPFGKLIHEYMGFEQVAYALHDDAAPIREFLALQEAKDLELVRLAAGAPGRIAIISDHADENLISPAWYRAWCIPYYKKACGILHAAGKLVSTHLDGNFKGYLPFIGETGFDLLDGCTPAPMFNWEPEDLAAATTDRPGRPRIGCYCGVPASLFTTGADAAALADFGERIARAFDRRVIVNVGDILPPNGSIEAVQAVGRRLAGLGS